MQPYNKVFLLAVSAAICLCFSPCRMSVLEAQIFDCNGTWTNHPCPGATVRFTVATRVPGKNDSVLEQKQILLRPLISARYRVKSDFGHELSTKAGEDYCLLTSTSVEACAKRVESELDRLESKTIERERLRIEQEELSIRKQEDDGENQLNSTTVVIQNIAPASRRSPVPHFPPFQGTVIGPETRVPAPSRGEVPNDARVPLPN